MGRLLASGLRMGPERTRWTAPGGGVGAEARDGVRQPGVNGSEAEASSSARLPDGERRAEARVERERRRRAETGSRAETREGSGSSPDDMDGAESEALGAVCLGLGDVGTWEEVRATFFCRRGQRF